MKHWKLILSTILLIPAIYVAIIWIVPIVMFFPLYGFKEACLTLERVPTRAFIWMIISMGYIIVWFIKMNKRYKRCKKILKDLYEERQEINEELREMQKKIYQPKIVRGYACGTGTPLDGQNILYSLWEHDNHSRYHLYGWDDAADEAVMKTFHQTDELYSDMPIEEFKRLWDAEEYEPDGAFVIDLDQLDVKQVISEEKNARKGTEVDE